VDAAALIERLAPLTNTIATLDLAAPDVSEQLNAAHPLSSLGDVITALREARDAGWLTPRRGTDSLTFGRLAKPDAADGFAIDVVDMEGEGAAHTHTLGEVDLCIAESGDPRFDGDPEGWVVKPPGSRHIPTVTGGRMLIVYWLPSGAIAWG
jgi:hypothetical protein